MSRECNYVRVHVCVYMCQLLNGLLFKFVPLYMCIGKRAVLRYVLAYAHFIHN